MRVMVHLHQLIGVRGVTRAPTTKAIRTSVSPSRTPCQHPRLKVLISLGCCTWHCDIRIDDWHFAVEEEVTEAKTPVERLHVTADLILAEDAHDAVSPSLAPSRCTYVSHYDVMHVGQVVGASGDFPPHDLLLDPSDQQNRCALSVSLATPHRHLLIFSPSSM